MALDWTGRANGGLDPLIPHLAVALDPAAMAARLTAHFHAAGMSRDWSVAHGVIEKISYRPGRHCGLLYRLSLEAQDGRTDEEWLYARAFTPTIGPERYANARKRMNGLRPASPVLKAVPPVGYLDDLDVFVALFPFDVKMPWLERAADPEAIRQVIESHPGLLGEGEGAGRCTGVTVRRLKYMAGKRCVLRVVARFENERGDVVERSCITKTYDDGESRVHFDRLLAACDHLATRRSPLEVPRPILHHEETRTVWSTEWIGVPLLRTIGTAAFENAVRQAARAVADLHRSGIEGLPEGPDAAASLARVAEDIAEEHAGLPERPEIARRILQTLEAHRDVAARSTPIVSIHGACRAEQMLIRDDRVALVDFDAFALGDPLQDVAEFIASLEFLEITAGRSRAEMASAARAFLEAYAANVPWDVDPARVAWYALAYTSGKMCSVRHHLDLPALARLATAADGIVERGTAGLR